jgi:hypothetical protein
MLACMAADVILSPLVRFPAQRHPHEIWNQTIALKKRAEDSASGDG